MKEWFAEEEAEFLVNNLISDKFKERVWEFINLFPYIWHILFFWSIGLCCRQWVSFPRNQWTFRSGCFARLSLTQLILNFTPARSIQLSKWLVFWNPHLSWVGFIFRALLIITEFKERWIQIPCSNSTMTDILPFENC